MKNIILFFLAVGLVWAERAQAGSSVLFIHPDGAGLAQWQAARMYLVGPDADLNWDRLPHLAVYRGHMRDNLTATSNGGATTHAYGVKVPSSGFGSDGASAERPVAASGQARSLLHEALEKGLRTGLINSGSIIEPGTAAFVASVASRKESADIAAQVVGSGVDVILSGGEEWLLPDGVQGRHGPGLRQDGRNLIEEARAAGYTVVFTADELAALPTTTRKVLGVFAQGHTFLDVPPEEQRAKNLPSYHAAAPDLASMLSKTLELFGGEQFFLVVEEEGSDNFGNCNNAVGVFEALRRADAAFGVGLAYLKNHPQTLLLTAADSEAGDMDVIGLESSPEFLAALATGRDHNGAPYGLDLAGQPFVAQPDQFGQRLAFVVSWGSLLDTSGGILVRAAGAGAEAVRGTMDNTALYQVMRQALFSPNP